MRPLLVVLLTLLPAAASAQEFAADHPGELESSRDFFFEARGGRFRPDVDSSAGLTGTPYKDTFGNKAMWLFEGELDYELWKGFGTLSAGLAAGYGTVYGHGIVARSGEQAEDSTVLKTVPLRALAVYRFDWLSRRFSIPLVPYGKVGLADTIWWITNGAGDVATFGSGDTADEAVGGKWGYQLTGGLALELNFLDPILGREFDSDFGVNRVLAFGELMRLTADNFGSAGLDLSDTTWMFGLGFEF